MRGCFSGKLDGEVNDDVGMRAGAELLLHRGVAFTGRRTSGVFILAGSGTACFAEQAHLIASTELLSVSFAPYSSALVCLFLVGLLTCVATFARLTH
jgi:hypothetical protein